jgi:putative acetyltransferase
MECMIRHAEPGDAPALHAILTSPHVIDGSMRLPFSPLSSTEARLEPQPGYHHLIAVEGEEVVGFAEFVTHPTVPRHAHAGELNMIVVREDRQGRGIGQALMAAVLNLADNWLMLDRVGLIVWVRNQHAVRLYQARGFEIEGTMRNYVRWRGQLIDAHVMGRLRPGDDATV